MEHCKLIIMWHFVQCYSESCIMRFFDSIVGHYHYRELAFTGSIVTNVNFANNFVQCCSENCFMKF